ncbi:MAG: hypothetical protein CMA62_01595 [Euryarchaeota archaeon]|nr:hypothetical protein [Euryarchaeota archaeon]DAC46347.1 MAG TPA: hypothetical protein D7H82_04060 [Candidatus Poseidoniales archaeon]HII34052.1 hypothetical protein [Candidatus Thalassarchaeaceae archaeon]|tara:strand:+ start:11203 stop:12930 length:1728 start_codon:yes stop_codon:yes gene_type:complete
MSKRIAVLQTLIMLMSLVAVSGFAAAQENEATIDSSVTWESDGWCDYEHVRIVDGGELTIRDVVFDLSCDITIEEGGVLNVEDSVLGCDLSEEPDGFTNSDCGYGLKGYGYWDEGSRASFRVPNEGIEGDFTMTMHSVGGASYYGAQAFIGDSDPISLNGSSHTFEFSDTDGEDIWIGLIGYGQSPVSVSHVIIEVGNEEIELEGYYLESMNMMAAGERGHEIVANGHISLSGSSLVGTKLIIGENGSLVSNSSALDRVGPILSQGDGSIVRIVNSTFSNSLDDHDVRGTAFSEITWENSVGSGGFTDRWERRVVDQKVIFDSKGVVFRVNGMGVSESTSFDSFSDDYGEALVNGGGERVVEVGWSNGTIWSESATIEIISYRTGWNPDGSGIDDYGGYSVPLSWHDMQYVGDNTPYIEWMALDFVEEEEGSDPMGYSGGSVPMRASFSNSGTASASFYISCDVVETGLDADIGGFQGIVLGAGESGEILFDWRGGETGDFTLNCEALTPTQLVSDDSFGGGSMASETISWTERVDEESLPMVSILVAIFVSVLLVGMWLVRSRSEVDEEEDYIR